MGYRRFTDRDGNAWEIRDQSRFEWDLIPVGENSEGRRTIPVPDYESDPFELSAEELQKLLDQSSGGGRARPAKNPFRD